MGIRDQGPRGQNVDYLFSQPGFFQEAREQTARADHAMVTYVEAEAISRHGRRFPAEVAFDRAEVDGAMIYTLAARDITERREYENRCSRPRKWPRPATAPNPNSSPT